MENRRPRRLRWVEDPCGCSCWRGADEEGGRNLSTKEKKKRNTWSRMRSENGSQNGSQDVDGDTNGVEEVAGPDHLVILVNGIVGSANDWKFASQRMRGRLGSSVAIHCSVNNAGRKTFDGLDVMGERLANEVKEVISRTPSATKISFLGHSLGGLISRSAISHLYNSSSAEVVGGGALDGNGHTTVEIPRVPTIGGLQAENFITLATPHLGCRGSEQLPFLLGISAFERIAPSMAHLFIGKTGRHLFLTDASKNELPLLRKMVTDCNEGQFLSSLGAFKKRVAYANVVNDHMVGWRTSSLRLRSEKPQKNLEPVDSKYPHVIREEEPVAPLGEELTVDVLRKEGKKGRDVLEEEMVVGLAKLAWHRVDVRFRGVKGSLQAHNLIQVKNPKTQIAGADVIDHVMDKHFT
jgi:pimeloyl-ACP methyl ester carboxylesterase